jgi:hypothetical protein
VASAACHYCDVTNLFILFLCSKCPGLGCSWTKTSFQSSSLLLLTFTLSFLYLCSSPSNPILKLENCSQRYCWPLTWYRQPTGFPGYPKRYFSTSLQSLHNHYSNTRHQLHKHIPFSPIFPEEDCLDFCSTLVSSREWPTTWKALERKFDVPWENSRLYRS